MTARGQSRALKVRPARMAGLVATAAVAVAATRATHIRRSRLVISGPFPAATCRHACFGTAPAPGCPGIAVDAGPVGGQKQHTLHTDRGGHGVEATEGERAVAARPPGRLALAQHRPADRDVSPPGHSRCSAWFAVGLLHVVAASLSGGGAGSRAEEANKPLPRGAGSVRLGWGLVRRALDADPAPVTLPARREGAHPSSGATA